jgi:hypothetical protein
MRSLSRYWSGTAVEKCKLSEQVKTLAMRLGHKSSDQYQDNRTAGDKMAEVLAPLYAAVFDGHAIQKCKKH